MLESCSICCSVFQNNVEIHVNHIQSGLTQTGNLQAFASSSSTMFWDVQRETLLISCYSYGIIAMVSQVLSAFACQLFVELKQWWEFTEDPWTTFPQWIAALHLMYIYLFFTSVNWRRKWLKAGVQMVCYAMLYGWLSVTAVGVK